LANALERRPILKTLEEKKQEILKKFGAFEQWEERYKLLLDFGKKLSPMDEKYKVDKYLVPGCISKVWLYSEEAGDKLVFYADSESAMARGMIGLLVYVYSGQKAEDILAHPADFLSSVGIDTHLSMSRRNGIANMCRLIFSYAGKDEDE
jgi:cysteine desulfuration protein SufE